MYIHNLYIPWKKVSQYVCYFCNFPKYAPSKQLPNGRKSGHPASKSLNSAVLFFEQKPRIIWHIYSRQKSLSRISFVTLFSKKSELFFPDRQKNQAKVTFKKLWNTPTCSKSKSVLLLINVCKGHVARWVVKKCRKCRPTHFSLKLINNFYRVKKYPQNLNHF
jgi:hypothetical protein